jgi:predicted TIM-barrel fold metal-dependent hydrolase
VGVKIHPELHGYTIRRYGRRLMEFAERRDAVVLTHSGQPKSLPAHFADLANDFPSVRLILAHLGFGHDRDISLQVRAIQKSRHGNLYADTSSSMSIVSRLIEWAVAEVGADRLLFGTDTPLYFAAMQRARIEAADISAADKRRILRDNARRLLRIDLPGR